MTDQMPAPGPTGYQPSPGEGITSIAFEVTPSWGYQKVAVQGTYVFPEPRSYSEALPAIEELYAALEEDAAGRVDSLVALKNEREAARKAPAPTPAAAGPAPATQPAPSQAAPAQAPHPAQSADQLIQSQLGGQEVGSQQPGQMPWAVGQKPNNRGSFKYLPTSAVSSDDFKQRATRALQGVGVDPAMVVVFDDRTGQYGLEGGNTSYSAGKAKAGNDTQLKQLLGNRDTVAYLDFEQDGSVRAGLTKDAKSALQAIQMQSQLQQPQQAPPPTDNDLPF